MLDCRHYQIDDFKQRMGAGEWRKVLLSGNDIIIYKGNLVPLKAERLGYGVVEVSKDLAEAREGK